MRVLYGQWYQMLLIDQAELELQATPWTMINVFHFLYKAGQTQWNGQPCGRTEVDYPDGFAANAS